MRIEILYFDGCPHWEVAERRLKTALQRTGRGDVTLHRVRVTSPEHADQLGFVGSPTVRIDGQDPFATGAEEVGFACRVYSEAGHGLSGSPSVEQFMEVLT